MIWHIFKKDWALLWKYAAGIGALHIVLNAARLSEGRFYQMRFASLAYVDSYLPGRSLFVASFLPVLAMLGSALLILTIVHQDAIPGLRQDWLVRPIRRRDLVLSKLLSILILVQVPISAADFLETIASGFSLASSVGAALSHSVYFLLSFSLPLFAFASLTKNFMEAIAGGVAVALGIAMLSQLTGHMDNGRMGVDWMDFTMRTGILVAGAAILLSMQYFRRKTILARGLTVAVSLFYWLVPQMPWQAAFALEQRLSPQPGAGDPVGISFVPNRDALVDRRVGPYNPANAGGVFVLMPVRATGVPIPSVLLTDYSTARLFAQGETHELGGQMGFQIWRERAGEGEQPVTYGIRVPRALYQRIADQPVRVELDYSLTLLGLTDSQTLPAGGGDARTKELGWCGTRLSEDGSDILYGCFQAGDQNRCTSLILEHPPTGARNPRIGMCRPDYSPYRYHYERDDALGRFNIQLHFTDPSIVDASLVKASMLPDATVTARAYRAQDHFVRHVVIPEIRLKDWATE